MVGNVVMETKWRAFSTMLRGTSGHGEAFGRISAAQEVLGHVRIISAAGWKTDSRRAELEATVTAEKKKNVTVCQT